jgi:hypothetical protein
MASRIFSRHKEMVLPTLDWSRLPDYGVLGFGARCVEVEGVLWIRRIDDAVWEVVMAGKQDGIVFDI